MFLSNGFWFCERGFSPSVGFADSSLQQSRKAANLMVCRTAFSRLPTAQSKIEARHRCLQPATSPRETFGFQRGAAGTLLCKVSGAYHQVEPRTMYVNLAFL